MFLGLGSNLGDREAALSRARVLLTALPGTTVTAESGIYVTAPVGGPEQDDYLNQVVEVRTLLSPYELLTNVQGIEAELGRVRDIRWGPRTIDVDILWYHGFSSADARLEVPHPRMEERRFVLEPLAELAPDLVLPSGLTVTEALAGLPDQAVRRNNDRTAGTVSRRSERSPMDHSIVQKQIRRLYTQRDSRLVLRRGLLRRYGTGRAYRTGDGGRRRRLHRRWRRVDQAGFRPGLAR